MKKSILAVDDSGNKWVTCPTCYKRQFPCGDSIIHNLKLVCKRCKSSFTVNYNFPHGPSNNQYQEFDKGSQEEGE